jgi:hypothetical protein
MTRYKAVLFYLLCLVFGIKAQTYSATYLPSTAPKTTEEGQTGTNQCGTGFNQTGQCQNAYSEWFGNDQESLFVSHSTLLLRS